MVVREEVRASVVIKSRTEVKRHDFLYSLVELALFKDLAKDGFAEVVRFETQDLGVEGCWEESIPESTELFVRVRERANELVVEVQDIVDHVVADQRAGGSLLASLDDQLDDVAEPHLAGEHLLLVPIFGCHLFLHLNIQSGYFLTDLVYFWVG